MELISAKPPAFDASVVTIFSVDRLHHLPVLCAFHQIVRMLSSACPHHAQT